MQISEQDIIEYKEKFSTIDVLYIEDDNELRQEGYLLFSNFFKSVDTAENGQEGLEKYKKKNYDIVITDILMPIMDGLDMSRKIRLIDPEQVIIVTSAYSTSEYFIESIDIGIDAYILKPFTIEKVLRTIEKVAINISMRRDISFYHEKIEEIVNKEEEWTRKITFYDQLTGLSNNICLIELLKEKKDVNVLLLNVDNFGNINDIYGFDSGDEVLVEVVRLLNFVIPKHIKIFRTDSDEFVLVDETNMANEKLSMLAESIVSFFNESEIEIDDGINIKVSFSIGIAKGNDVTVLKHARIAIKELREHRRGSYKFFDEQSIYIKKQEGNRYWINKIKQSINSGELFAFFQPIYNNNTKKIEKYECLSRMMDDGKLISPIKFMEAAKKTGTLFFITQTIIEQSCKAFSNNDIEFSINITNDDLYMEYLESYLIKSTTKYNIDPSRIVLEILEDVSTLNELKILEQLNSLRSKGFKIAIDDFGSESSNFSRLLEFKPDYLKIDGSFIKNILVDEKSEIIVEAIILLAHKSGIKVIAEFVHSKEVQDRVVELGIDYSQGYYLGEPSRELQG